MRKLRYKVFKILITGATGYLGSALVHSLLNASAHYEISVLKRSTSNIWRLSGWAHKISFFDVDQVDISRLFAEKKFDLILHCATLYGRKNESLSEMAYSNVILPLRVLESAINGDIKTFINIDTMLSDNISRYSVTKSQFRQWLRLASAEINVVNIRLEHFYGPGDGEEKFVTFLIKSLLQNKSEIPLTSGLQLRDFVYIDDVIQAIMVIFSKTLKNSGPNYIEYEVGLGFRVSIREIAELCKLISGNRVTKLNFGALPSRSGDDQVVEVNLQALKELGWTPKWDLTRGISQVIFDERKKLK